MVPVEVNSRLPLEVIRLLLCNLVVVHLALERWAMYLLHSFIVKLKLPFIENGYKRKRKDCLSQSVGDATVTLSYLYCKQ